MANLDLKLYWAIFLRRLPYFLVIAAFIATIGLTVAYILPPVYKSQASMLVEPQQIPGDLAQSTVPVDPYEQAQIIEQRIMTRTNLLDLANRIGLYEGLDMSAGQMVGDIYDRIEFIGFEPDVTRAPQEPGATIIGVAFLAGTPAYALKGANELISLVLQENVKLRTDRAGDTLTFFQGEVDRLSQELERQSAKIAEFKTAHVDALPDSMAARRAQQERAQQRLLDLEREESDLKNQRATVVWVFERTGRAASINELSNEEQDLETFKSQFIQDSTVYAAGSPQIRLLKNRIAALEKIVADQRAQRAVPDAEGNAAPPLSELDAELAPIDSQLKFIAEDKAQIEKELADLEASIQATPNNEMTLGGLERELDNIQRQHDEAVASLGQAQVGERIEVLSKGERFSLIEPPSEPVDPVSPKRGLIAAAGVVGGVGAGIGFIVLLEMLNRSIRRPVDISTGLGIQPFATVPYIRTRHERRWKRTVIGIVLGIVVVVIPLALFAVHTLYEPLDVILHNVRASLQY
jgi:polysaccharide chain length determinant protein (PEP-CTERM system associated)